MPTSSSTFKESLKLAGITGTSCTALYAALTVAGISKFGWVNIVLVSAIFLFFVNNLRARRPGGFIGFGTIVSCCAQAGIYAGIFVGLAEYILNHYVVVAAYQKLMADAMREVETRLTASGFGQDEIDRQLAMVKKLGESPLIQLGAPVLMNGAGGTLLGLVAGAIFRRDPPEFGMPQTI